MPSRHQRGHAHPCARCGQAVECDGDLERNWDGWPPVICPAFHLAGGTLNANWLCEDCAELVDRCDEAHP